MPDDPDAELPLSTLETADHPGGPDLRGVVTSSDIRRARALLGWSTVTLARKARADYSALVRAQMPKTADPLDPAVLASVQRTFEAAGLVFDANAGVRLRRHNDPASR